jgi:hypothetical protein
VASTGARHLQRPRLAGLGRRAALKLRVLLTRSRLDAELADGVDPHSTAMLELRATQLQRPRYRRQLAAALDERLIAALRGPRLPSSAVPVVRDQISEASGTLLSLAQVLRASESVHPRGIAMVLRLLSDGDSPLYHRTVPGALERQARLALDCLVGQPWVSSAGLRPLEGVSHGGS